MKNLDYFKIVFLDEKERLGKIIDYLHYHVDGMVEIDKDTHKELMNYHISEMVRIYGINPLTIALSDNFMSDKNNLN